MGVSFENRVALVCEKDESKWVTRMPERLPASHMDGWADMDVPVETKVSEDGRVIELCSIGYGTYDLSRVKLPRSLRHVVTAVWSLQSDGIDYVDTVDAADVKGYDWDVYEHEDITYETLVEAPEEPEQGDDESDDAFDVRYEAWEDYAYGGHLGEWMDAEWTRQLDEVVT